MLHTKNILQYKYRIFILLELIANITKWKTGEKPAPNDNGTRIYNACNKQLFQYYASVYYVLENETLMAFS